MTILMPKLTSRDLPGALDWIDRVTALFETTDSASQIGLSSGPETDGDVNFASVSVLLHGDGADASTTFTDSSANAYTFTASGNAQISTVQFKYGGASMAFDGTGDYVTMSTFPAPLQFGTSAFTLEGWFYCTDASTVRYILSTQASGGSIESTDHSWAVYIASDATLGFGVFTTTLINSVTVPAEDVWHHFAISYDGVNLRLFLNGVLESTVASSVNYSLGHPLTVGFSGYTPFPGPVWAGYLDDIRITKGVCRYVTSFDPPTSAYPDSA